MIFRNVCARSRIMLVGDPSSGRGVRAPRHASAGHKKSPCEVGTSTEIGSGYSPGGDLRWTQLARPSCRDAGHAAGAPARKRSPPPALFIPPPRAPFTCGCGPVMKEGRRSTPPVSAITGCGWRVAADIAAADDARVRDGVARLLIRADRTVPSLLITAVRADCCRGCRAARLRDEAGSWPKCEKLSPSSSPSSPLLRCRRAAALVLAELLLGRRDQAEVMFGVLVVVLGATGSPESARHAPAGLFFSDVRGGAANLDIGSVRFEYPGHRVLTAPVVVVIVVVIPVTHPLVVLTVSHVSPLFQP